MRSEGIVLLPPLFDEDLGLLEGVEDLPVKELISQLADEGFIVAFCPEAVLILTGEYGFEASLPGRFCPPDPGQVSLDTAMNDSP